MPEEARVLDAKIEDLDALVAKDNKFDRPGLQDLKRLKLQLWAMRRYSAALHDRMESWKTAAEDAAAEAAKLAPRFDP